MSIVPNVSSIFRDISHISTSSGLIIKGETPVNFSLEPKKIEENTCFEGLHDYKQQRHNELLARLRNSTEEHQRLIGGIPGTGQNDYSTGNIEKFNSNTASREYDFKNTQANSSNNGYQSTNNKIGNRFVIPKIRYRHIEDVALKSNDGQINQKSVPLQEKNLQLEKEFYEDLDQNKNLKVDGCEKNTLNEESNLSLSTKTKFNNRINKGNLKYEEKLESYYEMCKKNVPQKGQEAGQKEEKFVRPSSTNKKAMNLDEAIKMLSLC